MTSAKSKLTLDGSMSPDPTWFTWPQAPFRFFPEPARTPEEVRAGLISRLEACAAEHDLQISLGENSDFGISLRIVRENGTISSWQLNIDAEEAQYWLYDTDTDIDNDEGIIGTPQSFEEDLNTEKSANMLGDDISAFRDIVFEFNLDSWRDFAAALGNGTAIVLARPNNIFANFIIVPSDLMCGMTVARRIEDGEPADQICDASWPNGD